MGTIGIGEMPMAFIKAGNSKVLWRRRKRKVDRGQSVTGKKRKKSGKVRDLIVYYSGLLPSS
jgi:hypothetical protein